MKNGIGVLILFSLLVGCTNESTLPGERIDIDIPLKNSIGVVSDLEGNTVGNYENTLNISRNVPINIPIPRTQGNWLHVTGNRQHNPGNLRLQTNLQLLWQVSIGTGNSATARISTEPISAGGRIFTMDAAHLVRAFSLSGSFLWERNLTYPGNDPNEVSGGGLAFGEGLLIASTSFGELYAIDPSTGRDIWVQEFSAPATSAPTIANGRVYLVTKDNKSWAVNIETGKLDWSVLSIEGLATVSGNGGPAITSDSVILGYPSGEIISAELSTGTVIWRDFVGGSRGRGPISVLTGITASPVVVDNRVYISNQSGSTVAFDLATGSKIWSVPEGSFGSVLKIDNSVFLISDTSELIRIDADSGNQIWSVGLPNYKDDRPRRRKAVYSNFGPLMANGQIIVASGDGLIRFFDPVTAELVKRIPIPNGAATPPIIVNNVLYIISTDGTLFAFG